MLIVFFTSCVALLLTFLDSRRILPKGMTIGFVLVTLLGCIHYDYGNDYMSYYDIYKSIISVKFNFAAVWSGIVYKEPGWAFLCYLFKPFGGFFMMVACLNIIQNVIIYRIIKSNVDQKWWPFATFIYLFSSSYYLLSFSMMRQMFVICVFFGLWSLIKQKKWYLVFLILLLCSSVHKSALILLPFSFAGLFPISRGRFAVILYVFLYLTMWFAGDFMNDTMALFLSFDEFSNYAYYSKDTANNTYRLGFIMNLIPLILSLIYIAKAKKEYKTDDKLMVMLSIVSFIIAPFSEIIPVVGRIGLYFGSYQIIAIPKVYSNVNNNLIRWGVLFVFCFMTMHGYFGFFSSPVYRDSYSTFHTIFSVL